MFLYIFIILPFSYFISFFLPFFYVKQKLKFIESCNELANENDEVACYPFRSLVIFSVPALVYYLSSDLLLLIFCFILAVAAYTDLCKRWIPDLIIFLLLAISVYSLHSKDLTSSLFSVFFYLMPVTLLSFYGFFVKKESWIASGDYYIFPSIGLMLLPEYAAVIMLITLFILLLLMRWIKQIPLVTVAYFTFTGFNICHLSGFF